MPTSLSISYEEAFACCSCRRFAQILSEARVLNASHAHEAARTIWWNELKVLDWLEAFAAHPELGDSSLQSAEGTTATVSRAEQAGVASGGQYALEELRQGNRFYKEKYGHVFLVCAAGKSAKEILEQLRFRVGLSPPEELLNAANEQMKITSLRLHKLLTEKIGDCAGPVPQEAAPPRGLAENPPGGARSPITTHVLDIAAGRAVQRVPVVLQRRVVGSANCWERLGGGETNEQGRVTDLLPGCRRLVPGVYRLTFDTETCYGKAAGAGPAGTHTSNASVFFPRPSVEFVVAPGQEDQHFHVPLTYAPFGYSTYRGT